jgi:CubicO group peptidase (beta-lactamase class C family)
MTRTTPCPSTIAVLLSVALGGAGCQHVPWTYRAPEAVGDGWETGDAVEAGLDPALLTAAVNAVRDGEYDDVDSMLVARHGRLVHEAYFGGFDRNRPHDLRSATKSITSMLIGIAVDDGLLSGADERVLARLPEYAGHQNPDARKEEIRVEHLLAMTPGLDCDDWNGSSPGNEERMYRTNDWVRFIVDLRMLHPPGAHWAYCTGGVVTLGAVLASAAGRPADEIARDVLFGPLGIVDYHWEYTPAGQVDTGGHIHMRPRDMAKLGQLMLNGGLWNGERLLSESWIRESTARQSPADGPDYGYLWWRRQTMAGTRAFFASGNGGQSIIVVPDLDLVAVFTGSYYNKRPDRGHAIFDRFIVPAVQ